MSEAKRVLVVDDEQEIREPLRAFLERYGFCVTVAADGAEMRAQLSGASFDLILLDLMLPGEDGFSLCRYVHEHLGIPVIMLTAMGDPVDRVAGIELGADDYVVKPFDPRELVARMRGILRRIDRQQASMAPAMTAPRRYAFDRWVLDTGRRALIDGNGQTSELSASELRLLRALLEHANTVLSRDQLLDLIKGGGAPVFDRSVDSQVSRLRKKLENDSRHPRLLRTAWGDGYLLSAEVRLLAS